MIKTIHPIRIGSVAGAVVELPGLRVLYERQGEAVIYAVHTPIRQEGAQTLSAVKDSGNEHSLRYNPIPQFDRSFMKAADALPYLDSEYYRREGVLKNDVQQRWIDAISAAAISVDSNIDWKKVGLGVSATLCSPILIPYAIAGFFLGKNKGEDMGLGKVVTGILSPLGIVLGAAEIGHPSVCALDLTTCATENAAYKLPALFIRGDDQTSSMVDVMLSDGSSGSIFATPYGAQTTPLYLGHCLSDEQREERREIYRCAKHFLRVDEGTFSAFQASLRAYSEHIAVSEASFASLSTEAHGILARKAGFVDCSGFTVRVGDDE